MKVKLIDIATQAGVSVSTVSRIINGDRTRPASQETSDKVWEIVRQLGYVPNKNAVNLVKCQKEDTKEIVKIGCIYTSTHDLNNDPFFSCIGIGIQTELNQKNYNLAYAISAANMSYEDLYSYIISHPADGVIVLGRFKEETLKMLKTHFDYLVYAGVNAVQAGFDEVICDGYDGAKTALQHLVDQGHEKIGYIGYIHDQAEGELLVNEHRYEAYCDMMYSLNKEVNKDHIVHTNLKTSIAYKNMKNYLDNIEKDKLPTAYYCANDATAFGVMKALKEHKIRVPEDVAIIGLDDVEMASFVTPTLSTIGIPRRELGVRAVKMLVEQIESKRDYPLTVKLPFNLIVRESSQYKIKGGNEYAHE